MTRFRWMTGAVLVVVVLVGAAAAFAQGPGGRRGGFGGPGDPGGRGPGRGGFGRGAFGTDLPLGQLDLSDAQRSQIRAIVTRAAEEQRPTMTRLRQAVEARRKAVDAQPFDEAQIRATTQALVTAETDMAIARARVRGDVLALLTSDQQTKLKALRAQREERMTARRTEMEKRMEQRRSRRGQ